MSMTWFKVHHEIVDDIKIRRFSAQEKWAWIVLLCLASKSSDRGTITADNDDLADYCEFNSTQDWLYYRDKLISKGMLEINGSGDLAIVHWNDRQAKKPSDDPARIKERVAKSRAKKKTDTASQSQEDVTRYNAIQAECNANVSPQIRLDKNRSEEIREDQTRSDPRINNSCVRLHSEISSDQVLVDRIEKTRLLEQAKWTPAEIDCKTLAKNDEFAEYVRTIYLPTTAHYSGKDVDMSNARNWIVDGYYDPAKRLKVEIQLEAFETWRSRQKTTKYVTQKDDRPRLRKPNPLTWTAEQENWTYEQWEKFLNEQNTSNTSIYAAN